MLFLKQIFGALIGTALCYLIDRTFGKKKTVNDYVFFFFLILIAVNLAGIYESYKTMPPAL